MAVDNVSLWLKLLALVSVSVVAYSSRLSRLQPWISKESAEFARLEEV